MADGISVVICCYNSAKRLPETLKHIAAQQVNRLFYWEVLVIDNNSEDNTRETAYKEWRDYGFNEVDFRVIDEPRLGLSYARQRGIKESKFRYLLFCDDDNWLSPTYLKIGFEIFKSNPAVGVIGGRGIEAPEGKPPDWFSRHRLTYAIGPQSETSGDITDSKGEVYGAGAFFRREALIKLYENGFKSLLRDRTGTELSSGGDTELCICLKLLGYRVWYDERLIFNHFIPEEKLSAEYFIKLHRGISRSLAKLLPYHFIIHSSIQYENRNWIRKHWLWFLSCRVSHILAHGYVWNLLHMHFKIRLTDRNLKAIFHIESVKALIQDKENLSSKYLFITNSRWYKNLNTP